MEADFTKRHAGSRSPAALMLAEEVEELRVGGSFDEASQTWSTREYACAGAKKHNESM